MPSFDTQSAASPAGAIGIHRIALPALLFSGALCVLLLLSWYFLLPRFTQFQLGATVMDARHVRTYENELERRLREAESERDGLVLPLLHPDYRRLQAEKAARPSLARMRAAVLTAAGRASDAPDAIVIARLSLSPDGRVRLSGDVRNSGPRSMTILARFTETLREMEGIADLQAPAFTRREDPVIGPHSPFVLSFTFADPS